MGVGLAEWSYCKLGEALTLQRGFDLPHRLRREGAIPIVSSSGVSATNDTARVSAPGIVTGRYGTIGQVFFVTEDFWPLNTTLYVRDFRGNNPLYLSYLLRTVDFASHSGKSGVPGVNRNDIHKLPVLLPPLPEQHAIAEALSDVDNLLTALEVLIAKKRAIKQGTMQQLLTGKTRLPGFSGEWNARSLRSCLSSAPGYGINAAAVPFDDSLPTYLRITDIGENSRFRPSPHVSVEHPNAASFFLNVGDLVFARTGASVGKSYLYESKDGPLVFAGFLIRVTPDSEELQPEFLSYSVQLQHYWDWVARTSVRSGQPGINGREYGTLQLRLPPPLEQTAIASVLSDMDAEIAALEARRTKTQAIKQGMMQQLLTGRVRLVEPAPAEVSP